MIVRVIGHLLECLPTDELFLGGLKLLILQLGGCFHNDQGSGAILDTAGKFRRPYHAAVLFGWLCQGKLLQLLLRVEELLKLLFFLGGGSGTLHRG